METWAHTEDVFFILNGVQVTIRAQSLMTWSSRPSTSFDGQIMGGEAEFRQGTSLVLANGGVSIHPMRGQRRVHQSAVSHEFAAFGAQYTLSGVWTVIIRVIQESFCILEGRCPCLLYNAPHVDEGVIHLVLPFLEHLLEASSLCILDMFLERWQSRVDQAQVRSGGFSYSQE